MFSKVDKNDLRFMKRALCAAKRRVKRGDFPVACVLVHRGKEIADCSTRKTKARYHTELDHAEITAIRKIKPSIRKGRIDPAEVTCYVTLEPCLMCFGALLIAGIRRIVYAYEDVLGGGTSCELSSLPPLYRDAKPEIVPHVMRAESLALFKKFWELPENQYLRGSLLHKHTMSTD